MKSILVSGANGFIGANLIQRLLEEDVQIYALLLETEIPRDVLINDKVKIVSCDLENIDCTSIDIPNDIDIFYHFAWIGVKPEDRKNYNIQIRNIKITLNCLRLSKEKHIKRFIMPGSTNEYLYSKSIINEKCIPSPKDDYGSVKVALRYLGKQYAVDNGIEFIYVVLSGIYSEQRKDNNVVSYTIDKLLKKERPSLTKLEQYWDYVHIEDAVEALFLTGIKGKAGKLYAIGYGDNWPLYNYIKIIHELIDPSLPLGIGDVPYSSDEIPMSCVDISDVHEDTGYVPKISFYEGCKRMIANWESM